MLFSIGIVDWIVCCFAHFCHTMIVYFYTTFFLLAIFALSLFVYCGLRHPMVVVVLVVTGEMELAVGQVAPLPPELPSHICIPVWQRRTALACYSRRLLDVDACCWMVLLHVVGCCCWWLFLVVVVGCCCCMVTSMNPMSDDNKNPKKGTKCFSTKRP